MERHGYPINMFGDVAVISIVGAIGKIAGLYTPASSKTTQSLIQGAVKDDAVKKIILRIDSPGGSVDGLAELGDTIHEAKQHKNIIAYVDGMAASAGYYIASQADKIYAGRADIVGSIGTILVLYDYSEMFEKAGIKPIVVATGDHKGAGIPGAEITDEHKAEFQKMVNFYFDDFLNAVSRGRNMGMPAVKDLADGRVFNAPEAKKLGLIDGIQTLQQTIEQASQVRTYRRTKAKAKFLEKIS